jgi:hypothetical protein
VGPKVVVNDRDPAHMNGVEVVNPDSAKLVCRYHVGKNV